MEELTFFQLSLKEPVGVLELSPSHASPKSQNMKSPVVLSSPCLWVLREELQWLGWLVAGTSRPVTYLSEQGKFGFGLVFFQDLYASYDAYSCNFHCIFIFFFNPECQQFSIYLSLQQLDFIHVLISQKRCRFWLGETCNFTCTWCTLWKLGEIEPYECIGCVWALELC